MVNFFHKRQFWNKYSEHWILKKSSRMCLNVTQCHFSSASVNKKIICTHSDGRLRSERIETSSEKKSRPK